MRSFLAFIDSESDWERGLQEFREKHYGLFDQVVPPLLQSEDKLLRLLLIRHADVSRRRELNLLKRLAQAADPIATNPNCSPSCLLATTASIARSANVLI